MYASLARLPAGATVILVEQDLGRGLAFADRVICLLEGRAVLDAPAAALTREQVTEAYFGLGGSAGPRRAAPGAEGAR